MAKAVAISAADLASASTRKQAATMRPRGAVPSAELVPLQFKMAPDWVKTFKQAALDRDMKLNQLLAACFAAYTVEEAAPPARPKARR